MPISALSAAEKAHVLAEALPFIRHYHSRVFVIKYGGNAMTEASLKAGFGRDLALMQLVGIRPVVVHGGGPQINALLQTMGVKSEFRQGMRVTDEATMHVVEMVVGELNQEIVGLINQHGGSAVGLSGQDGRFLNARKMLLPPETPGGEAVDIGLVGEIESINVKLINILQGNGFIPVVMPIAVGSDGQAYNVNADVVAGKLAETLGAEKLIMMTNTPGVLDKNGELIGDLGLDDIERLFADGTIHGGMLPKLASVLEALKNGVKAAHIIDGRVPNALLLEALTSEGVGTRLHAGSSSDLLRDSRRYFAGQPAAL